MASIVSYLGSAFSSTSGSLAIGDTQAWNELECNMAELIKQVESSLESDHGIDSTSLPPNFIEKCIRQGSGNIAHSVLVCKRFLDFRTRVQWPTVLGLADINHGALKCGMHWLLADKYGRAVFVFNPEHLDTKRCSLAEFQKMGMYLMEQVIKSSIQVQHKGVAILFDCRRIHVSSIFSMISYEDAKRGTEMWQDAFPCKLKSIMVVGLSSTTSSFIGLFLKVLPKKLRDRVSFLSMEKAAIELGVEHMPPCMHGSLKLDLDRLNHNTFTTTSTSSKVDSNNDENSARESLGCMDRVEQSTPSLNHEGEGTLLAPSDIFEDVQELADEDGDVFEDASDEEEEDVSPLDQSRTPGTMGVPADILARLAEIDRESTKNDILDPDGTNNINTSGGGDVESIEANNSGIEKDSNEWDWEVIVDNHIQKGGMLFHLKPDP